MNVNDLNVLYESVKKLISRQIVLQNVMLSTYVEKED
jgi:hypothetical protein